MTLAKAISKFIQYASHVESFAESLPESSSDAQPFVESLELVTTFFSSTDTLEDITCERLRDFLARWYVERASLSAPEPQVSEPQVLIGSLARFFKWAVESGEAIMAQDLMPVLSELEQTVPRAIDITKRLSSELAKRGGAISFPEFLTSFEEGGQSQYDFDLPGEASAMEGYFRITHVEGTSVEAEEAISEERVWPIIFPASVANIIQVGFIINLELVRAAEGWLLASSGFAYPPGTDI
jgi:hypothetical protein